jgi:hypothetical protein
MTVFLALLGMAALIWSGVSALGLLYPFKPFRTRKRALQSFGGAFALSLALAFYLGATAGPNPRTVPQTATQSAAQSATQSAAPLAPNPESSNPEPSIESASTACTEGTPAPGDVVAVTGDHDLHVKPDAGSDKIKNEKASKALGKLHFHQIDASTTVRRLCATGDWTEVQIVTPEWLTFVKGWVPNAALRGIDRSADGARIFVEADFYWDDDTARFKKDIIAVVNKIARENANCPDPDPGSVAKSTTKSKAGAPVFFVTCGAGADVFNLWFGPGDAAADKTFTAAQPLSQSAAVTACEAVARAAATHPSTVDFSRFVDLAYFAHKSGNVRVSSTFTAKNALNLELEYDITCFFEGNRMVDHTITESMN